MAYYITCNSVKLSYPAYLVHEICNKNGRKVIVFCDWLSSAWLVEVLLMILGFAIISIRARHKQKDREEAVRMFNDKDCPIQVLVTSVNISATAMSTKHRLTMHCLESKPRQTLLPFKPLFKAPPAYLSQATSVSKRSYKSNLLLLGALPYHHLDPSNKVRISCARMIEESRTQLTATFKVLTGSNQLCKYSIGPADAFPIYRYAKKCQP